MTQTLTSLIAGLQEIEVNLGKVVLDPTASRGRVMASGFIVGYIMDILPRLAQVSEADAILLESQTDQLLAQLRDAREARDA